eukprot:TRINITY_DN99455_c0_g1_i1.p1 TRINITY_DN99455_c0_g1~~TRINITY_DN99455_c0_g1_i1.p1  ORF type:complete len:286 (+),score=62.49 TRINITY_DN99455_c0_g1_i1:15-872(+)
MFPRRDRGGAATWAWPASEDEEAEAPEGSPRGTINGRSAEAPPYGHPRYGAAYWDAWYATAGAEMSFDWYVDYSRIRKIFKSELPSPQAEPEILDLGCGASEIPSRLFADGWHFVTAIDSSAEAIRLAKKHPRHLQKQEMQFLQMDVCCLDFPDECFDAVLDKATFDTIVTSGTSERPDAMLAEVYRVLKPGGVFLMVTHSGPARRLCYLAKDSSRPWKIEVARLAKGKTGSLQTDAGVPTLGASEETGGAESSSACCFAFLCTKLTPTPKVELDPMEPDLEEVF